MNSFASKDPYIINKRSYFKLNGKISNVEKIGVFISE